MPDKVENVQDDVVLTGEWEFKPHQYKVHYQFKADDGSQLPEEVMKQLPSSTTVDYGENVKPGKHQLTKVSDDQEFMYLKSGHLKNIEMSKGKSHLLVYGNIMNIHMLMHLIWLFMKVV